MSGMQDALKVERAASEFMQYLQSRNLIKNINLSSFANNSSNNSVIQSDPHDFTEMSYSQRANFEYRGINGYDDASHDEHKSNWNVSICGEQIRIMDDDRHVPSLPPSECQDPPLLNQLPAIITLPDVANDD
eukprot:135774_1